MKLQNLQDNPECRKTNNFRNLTQLNWKQIICQKINKNRKGEY